MKPPIQIRESDIAFEVTATFTYVVSVLPEDPDNPYEIARLEETALVSELSKIYGVESDLSVYIKPLHP